MSNFVNFIIGGLEIAAGIVVGVLTGWTGVGLALAGLLISAGVGQIISGVGTLISGSGVTQPGIAFATRNPVAPWIIAYGPGSLGGTVVYLNEFGGNDKYLDLVMVLASHTCESVDSLLFDKKVVSMVAQGYGYDSYNPAQQVVSIQHISRTNNVVTVILQADIPSLMVGDKIKIQGITGDRTLEGIWPVEQIITQVYDPPNPGSLVFTYISGGLPSIVDLEGQAVTTWAQYNRTVHMEVMLGTQTLGTTFPGMIYGTPYLGDLTNLVTPENQSPSLPNPWTANCSLVGKTCVFLRLTWDPAVYAGGLPAISFLVHGKNDIQDVRTSPPTVGYTENAALCIADFLVDTTWGFSAVMGTEIPIVPLQAAANVCDEDIPLATGGESTYSTGTINPTIGNPSVTGVGTSWTSAMNGGILLVTGGYFVQISAVLSPTSISLTSNWAGSGTAGQAYSIYYGSGFEPRYACNGQFDLSHARGEILQNMLTSCAGRLSYQGGQFIIQPAVWYGASPITAPDIGSMSGPFRWRATCSIRDLYNGVKGTYISPANNWHPSDIPAYAQDTTHGYSYGGLWNSGTAYIVGNFVVYNNIGYIAIANGTNEQPDISPSFWDTYYQDINLLADLGQRRWLDMQLPFTISASMAQRIAKIELLRRRHYGTGTFKLNMVGYQITALDVLSFDLAIFGWSNKTVEVLAHRFILDRQRTKEGTEVTVLGTEIDVQETDSAVYDWSTTEELTPNGYQQAVVPNPFAPGPPTNLTLESDSSTAFSTDGGLVDAVLVTWTPPVDSYVLNGGHMEIQYQQVLDYLTGTVAVNNASPNVSGTGTAWTSSMAEGTFTIGGVAYVVKSVTSATALVLETNYTGSNLTGQSYSIDYTGSWIALPSVNPSVTSLSFHDLADQATYNVQIRSVNAMGFPSAWVVASVVARGASHARPWLPYSQQYLFCTSGASFTMSQVQGSAGAQSITVAGSRPVNIPSATAGKPTIDSYASVTANGSAAMPVGTFLVEVFGIDSGGARTLGSNICKFTIPSSHFQASFNVSWGINTVGYEVFFGSDFDHMRGLGPVTPGSLPASLVLTSSVLTGYGPPDEQASNIHLRGKRCVHAGILDTNVDSITTGFAIDTVLIAVPSAPMLDEWGGRYLIILSKFGLPVTQVFSIIPILGNDTGSPLCSLSILHPQGTELSPGDLVGICTSADTFSGTSIGDSGFANPFSPGGLTPGAEAGNEVVILYDPNGNALGASADIIDNPAGAGSPPGPGTLLNTTQFMLPGFGVVLADGTPVAPGSGAVFIVVEKGWRADTVTSLMPNSIAPGFALSDDTVAQIPAADLEGFVAFVEALTQDINGNDSLAVPDARRLLYIMPNPAAPVTPPYYTITPSGGNATIDLANVGSGAPPGITQQLDLNGSAVNFLAPIWTGGSIVAGQKLALYWDQDATGGRSAPAFTGGVGGFASNVASQITTSGMPSTRTIANFEFDGNVWQLAVYNTQVALS